MANPRSHAKLPVCLSAFAISSLSVWTQRRGSLRCTEASKQVRMAENRY